MLQKAVGRSGVNMAKKYKKKSFESNDLKQLRKMGEKLTLSDLQNRIPMYESNFQRTGDKDTLEALRKYRRIINLGLYKK